MFFLQIITSAGFIALGGFLLKAGVKNLHFYNKIKNLPTSKIKSLAAGEVEIKGTVLANEKDPLLSPITKVKCVSYNLKVYQYVKKGKHSGWELFHQKTRSRPFYLSDETGHILVNPEGAEISNDTFSRTELNELLPEIRRERGEIENPSLSTNPIKRIFTQIIPGRFRYDEIYIPEEEQIYIMGYTLENKSATNNTRAQRLMIGKKEGKEYIITDEKEEEVQKKYIFNVVVLFLVGLFLIFFGIIQLFNIYDWISFLGGIYS